MSSFVWMKVLESTPERYDRGISMLSGGRIGEIYQRIAEIAAVPARRVLDIGCGTGAVTLACAARGAVVTGIDINAEMLDVARATLWPLIAIGTTNLIGTGLLFMDLSGTTPWYPSVVNTGANPATITLNEARCDGSGDCVMVCPRQVLKMNGRRRKVEIREPAQCIQCGACIVQCPREALLFRYADGSMVEAPTIRNTRLNLLGKRRTLHR